MNRICVAPAWGKPVTTLLPKVGYWRHSTTPMRFHMAAAAVRGSAPTQTAAKTRLPSVSKPLIGTLNTTQRGLCFLSRSRLNSPHKESDDWCEGETCRPIEREIDFAELVLTSKDPLILVIYRDVDPHSHELLWKLVSSDRNRNMPRLVTIETSKLRQGWNNFARMIHNLPAVSVDQFSERIRDEVFDLDVPCVVGLYQGTRILTITRSENLNESIGRCAEIFRTRINEVDWMKKNKKRVLLQDRTRIGQTHQPESHDSHADRDV